MKRITLFTLALFTLAAPAAFACHDGSPILIDLDGDGIATMDVRSPVPFDLDGDGTIEQVAWTRGEAGDAFLWLDLNHNHLVDSGRELFGTATLMPSGAPAENGFAAMQLYDTPDYGGNGDGKLTHEDFIFEHLQLWEDLNRDGISQPTEISTLVGAGVLEIALTYRQIDRMDGEGNIHRYAGTATLQGRNALTRRIGRDVVDVYFRIAHEVH